MLSDLYSSRVYIPLKRISPKT